jgi:1-acyl-sn-glycerol-3-phosphate acyltransferase
MWKARYIPVVRGDRASGEQCLETSANWIRRGVSVLFFPEGTRSPDGQLRAFKPGAFRVAAATGAPVLPVLISGSEACLPKNDWRIGRHGEVRLRIGEPIPSTDVTVEEATAFAARVHQKFVDSQATP